MSWKTFHTVFVTLSHRAFLVKILFALKQCYQRPLEALSCISNNPMLPGQITSSSSAGIQFFQYTQRFRSFITLNLGPLDRTYCSLSEPYSPSFILQDKGKFIFRG